MEPEQINVSSEPTHTPTKIKTFWIFILALIIVAGIVSWTAILFYPKQTTKNSPVSVNETDNWKTYRNDTYGFDFKYPTDSIIEESVDGSSQPWVSVGNKQKNGYLIYVTPNSIYLKEHFASQDNFSFTESYMKNGPFGGYLGKIMVNEKTGFQYRYCEPVCMISTIFQNNSNSFFTIDDINTDEVSVKMYNQILSTFKFSAQKFDYSKPFQKGEHDYFGVVTLTGYLSIRDIKCEPGDEGSYCDEPTIYKYASFNFTSTDNELINTYLNQVSGNSYIGEKSIVLGCYDPNKSTIESSNYDDDGFVKNIITGKELETFLSSSENKQIKLRVTKSYVSAGRGAPNCYSLFREFKVVD